jgi:hypothetical protein
MSFLKRISALAGFLTLLCATPVSNVASASSAMPVFQVYLPGIRPVATAPVTPPYNFSLSGLAGYFAFNGSLSGSYALSQNTAFTPAYTTSSPFPTGSKSWQVSSGQGLLSATGPISGSGDFSLGAWVQTTNGTDGSLVQQRDTPDYTGEFMMLVFGGKLCYWDYPNGAGVTPVCGKTTISDGNWHQVGVVRAASGLLSFYVDGKLDYSMQMAVNASISASCGLSIGFDQRDVDQYFAGNLSNVFLFSRALSPQDWQYLYTTRAPLE